MASSTWHTRADVFGDIELRVDPGAPFVVDSLIGPEEIYQVGSPADGSGLITDLVDSLATILEGTYEVETAHWGNRLLRTTVNGSEHRAQTGPLFGLLPVPRRLLSVARRKLTYGCQGSSGHVTLSV